eukprot:SAG22_NODE_1069_length_5726_cov_20.690954_6_plen_57_part_00
MKRGEGRCLTEDEPAPRPIIRWGRAEVDEPAEARQHAVVLREKPGCMSKARARHGR